MISDVALAILTLPFAVISYILAHPILRAAALASFLMSAAVAIGWLAVNLSGGPSERDSGCR